AISHATAACVAGGNPDLHVRIPHLAGFGKDEVIIPATSRNVYDAAIRAVGVRVIEVDTPDALQLAIGPKTAMIYIFAGPRYDSGPMSTEAICRVAKAHNVPVLVDAAAEGLTIPNVHLQRGPGVDLSNRTPRVTLRWDARALGITGREVADMLYDGEPRIAVAGSTGHPGGQGADGESSLSLVSSMMSDSDEKIVAQRIVA